ncbi:MAG: glycosyltransferase family 2 protein [Candidatus Sabulitectum sp.]|nr:glycosyltransferase family 2 protein [Candidatus Sabulitectum sp.]
MSSLSINPEVELSLSISVVIPAWNAGSTIHSCLDSIHRQTLNPLEVILVDDGSSDDTADKADKYGVVLLGTGGRKGPATARNMGASAAAGDVILFLDSDVIVSVDLIEKVTAYFEDESVWAVQTLYTPICPAEDQVSQYQNYYYYYSLNRMPEGSTATFATWCSAVRRHRFNEIGGFNVRIPEPTVEDEELGYTIVENGGIIILDKTIQVTHLASYTLAQFTNRRLRMARAQAKSGWRQVKKRLLARYINVHESGTHHSRWVVLSILLVLMAQPCILLSLFSLSLAPLIPAAFLLVSALACHFGFLTRCNRDLKRNAAATFAVLCLYDMAVLGWGIVQGSVQYMFGEKY